MTKEEFEYYQKQHNQGRMGAMSEVPTAMGGSYVVSGKDTIRDFAIIGGVVVLVFVAPEVYLYAMANPEVVIAGTEFISSYFPTGAPSSSFSGYSGGTAGYFYGYENFFRK